MSDYLEVPYNEFNAARFHAQYDKEQITLFKQLFHSKELRKQAEDMAWKDSQSDGWYFYWRKAQHFAGLLSRKTKVSYRDSLGYVLKEEGFLSDYFQPYAA